MKTIWSVGLVALVTIAAAAEAAAEPEILIDTDFGTADQEIVGNERVTGVMAEGWEDNSAWADDVWATWEPMEEEGRAFLRLDVTKVETGRYQLAHYLPNVEAEALYRLTFTARSIPGLTVQVGIRDREFPYQFRWEPRPRPNLAAPWQEYNYNFTLPKLDQPVGLWINVAIVGQLDLARLRLARFTRAEYVEELRAKQPGGEPRNLVRISRFPLGLQSGWNLWRSNSDGDDVRVEADPGIIGPSGAPSLRISTNEPAILYTAPFAVPLALEPHTASLYVKGSGEIKLTVLCGRQEIVRQSFVLPDQADWQRLSLTFAPVLLGQAYGLRIEGSRTFWLDALQVELGSEPGPYTSQLPCEVALACPPSVASVARVQFGDEPALVSYCVTGEAKGAVLRGKVINVYDDEKDLPSVDLGGHLPATGRVRYDIFGQRPFGPFRVEAWVENADGQRVSSYNELVVYRLPRPRYWGRDAPNSPFGVHTESTTRHNLMAKAIGANWTRLHDAGLDYIGWSYLEPEPGKWTFRDKEIMRYRRHHIKVLGELTTAPTWASYFPGQHHNGYFDRFYQPKRMEDYANYVRTVAERYRGVIDAYDVWNEPWIHRWWAVGYDESKSGPAGYFTSEDAPADFARLMRTAYQTAKSVDPNITVLGVNSAAAAGGAYSFGGEEWTRGIVEAGGLNCCDVICYHQYVYNKRLGYPGDIVERGFRTATGPIAERFGELPRPVWMTEGSAGRETMGPGWYHYTLPYPNYENVAETSDRLCRYVVSLLAQSVAKVFIYTMHNHTWLGAPSGHQALVSADGYLHPSGAAYGVLAWHLEDTKFASVVEVTQNVFAYLFQAGDGSRAVAVLSSRPGHGGQYVLPHTEGVTVTDLFGNPLPEAQVLGETLMYVSAAGPAANLEKLLLQ